MIEYVILLDYSTCELIKIKLTEDDLALASQIEDYEQFLTALEVKYDFRLKDCCWIATQTLIERNYNL